MISEEILKESKKIMRIFYDSFINSEFELIVFPKTNAFMSLTYRCESALDVKCKLLENCSRHCCITLGYEGNRRNKKMWQENTDRMNKYFNTNFSVENMELIYDKLGNGINRDLTIRFINSGLNINLLKEVTNERN